MTITSLNLRNKLPPKTIAGLIALSTEAVRLDIPILMVGATARQIVLEYGFGFQGSATHDIDFGIAINSWEAFKRLKGALISTGRFRVDSKRFERIISDHFEIAVDLVPFGEIESAEGAIVWPDDHKMIVSGFTEAFNNAITVQLADDLHVKIASPAGLAILKLVSWADRRANRDADDFWLIASHYLDLGNYERIFEELPEFLQEDNYDDKIAGAILLGRDLKKISKKSTRGILKSVLSDESQMAKLAIAIVSEGKGLGGEVDNIIETLQAVKKGLED